MVISIKTIKVANVCSNIYVATKASHHYEDLIYILHIFDLITNTVMGRIKRKTSMKCINIFYIYVLFVKLKASLQKLYYFYPLNARRHTLYESFTHKQGIPTIALQAIVYVCSIDLLYFIDYVLVIVW